MIRFVYVSFSAFFNSLTLALFSILAYFCLTDLTLHPGYQIFKLTDDYDDGIVSKHGASSPTSEEPMLSIKDLLTNMDYMLLVFTNGFYLYISATIELSAIEMAIYDFHWNTSQLSVVMFVSVCVYMVFFYFGGKKMYVHIWDIYIIYILGFVVFWIVLLSLMLPVLVVGVFDSVISQTMLVGFIICCKFFGATSGLTCGRSLVFYLVPDHSASFAEGFRNGTVKIFLFIGFLFVGFLYSKSIYIYAFPIFCGILYLCVLLLLLRREVYFVFG